MFRVGNSVQVIVSSKGPGSIPGHSTIFLCYQMNIKCPILTYKAEKPCRPFLPILPNRSFLDQSSSEMRQLPLSKLEAQPESYSRVAWRRPSLRGEKFH